MLRLPAEAIVGQNVGFRHTSPDLAEFARGFFACPAQQAVREIKSEVNGAVRQYLVVARKYHGGQAAVFIGMDITDSRRAQEEIRRLNRDLEHRVVERTAQLTAANRELENEIARRKRAEAEIQKALEKERELGLLNLASSRWYPTSSAPR